MSLLGKSLVVIGIGMITDICPTRRGGYGMKPILITNTAFVMGIVFYIPMMDLSLLPTTIIGHL